MRRSLAAAAGLLIPLYGLAPVAVAGSYPPSAAISVACSSTTPPSVCTATVSGADPGSAVALSFARTAGAAVAPTFVTALSGSANVAADASGRASASFRVTAAGTFTFTGSGTDRAGAAFTRSTSITLEKRARSGAARGSERDGLPDTGATSTSQLLLLGGGAMALGGAALFGARSRRGTSSAKK